MTTESESSPVPIFAVVGATGQQGGATARALLADGATVRALVRDPHSAKAKDLAARGAALVTADLDDPNSVRAAFTGATAVFAMTAPTPQHWTDGEVAHGKSLADAAHDAQVGHIVYVSVAGAERHTGIPHFESKRVVEQYIDSLDLHRTFVRPVSFMENFNRAVPVIENGTRVVRLPLPPDVPLQMIAVDDIGSVCAAALQNRDLVAGGAVEIAGDSRTGNEIAEVFGRVTNMAGRYEQLPLSSLAGDADRQAMYRWYAQPTSTRGDVNQTRQLAPKLADLPTWAAGQLRRY